VVRARVETGLRDVGDGFGRQFRAAPVIPFDRPERGLAIPGTWGSGGAGVCVCSGVNPEGTCKIPSRVTMFRHPKGHRLYNVTLDEILVGTTGWA